MVSRASQKRWWGAMSVLAVVAVAWACTSSSPPQQEQPEQERPGALKGAPEEDGDEEAIDEYYERRPYDEHYDIGEVYEAVCVDCHGMRGDGVGVLAGGFSFGAPEEEWNNGPTVDGILQTLEDGIHESAMREFPEFPDADRLELADYILELRELLKMEDRD